MIKRFWNKPEFIKEKLERINFKLYRYYAIDDNGSTFSLSNLKNSYIHFSNPNCFNDPFDSNIAATLSETIGHKGIIAKDMNEKHRIKEILIAVRKTGKNNGFIDFWRCFIKWSAFKEGDAVFFFDVLRYLYFLRKNQDNVGNNCLAIIEQENDDIDFNNDYCALDFLISDVATKKYLGIRIENITPKEITIDDYVGSIESMYRLVGKKESERKDTYQNLNDHLLWMKNKLSEAVFQNFKIACFSEACDSILMWSHYGNKHCGFCVEYDFKEMFSDGNYDKMISPVLYSDKRVSVVVKSDGVGKGKYRLFDRNYTYAIDCLFTKSSDWSYEKEWRAIVVDSKDIAEFNGKVRISKIILGANISDQNKKTLITIAQEKGVPVYQMFIDDSFYKLNIASVNT